jgi:hypothetical protein
MQIVSEGEHFALGAIKTRPNGFGFSVPMMLSWRGKQNSFLGGDRW